MDEDIDIEEHDVFDNPRIRTIFPDISQIKTEVPDFDSEPENQQPFSSQICYEDNPFEDDNYDDFDDDDEEMNCDDTPTDYNPEGTYFTNKIIIGSKPNLTTEVVLPETDLYIEALNSNTKVCLEDWGVILDDNPCFCRDCGTLFATINALDAHKMIYHSFLVELNEDRVIKRNFAKKSTVDHKIVDGQQCSHCKVMFPNVDALTRHLYDILGVKDNDNNSDESNSEETVDTLLKCPHCGCMFKHDTTLLKHLSASHGLVATDASKFAENPVHEVFNCNHCLSQTSSVKSYNAHIKKKHEDIFFMKVSKPNETVMYKCVVCKEVFDRYNLALYHRKSIHPNMVNKPFFKRIVRKPATATAKGKTPETKFVDVEIKYKRAPKRIFDITLYKQSRSVELTNSPIPKSVLFRCKKCDIHFISASLTMRHFPSCVTGCSKYIKCNRCSRVIRFEDRHIHEHQHNVSNKIKVYDISIRVLERTLCKCPKCETCYDDRDFWTHFDSCGDSEPSYCDKCDILVSAQNIEAHKFKHDNKINDFIVIDFVTITDAKTVVGYRQENSYVVGKYNKGKSVKAKTVNVKPKTVNLKANILNKNLKNVNAVSKIAKTRKVMKPRMTLRYCNVCECSFATLKHLKDYPKCKKYSHKVVCQHCGLYFTTNMIKRHKPMHRLKQITLHDFNFVDLIDSRKVIPKAPEYPQCSNCKVYFVNKTQVSTHKCPEKIFKNCGECDKKFIPLAFKLHIQFHLYSGVVKQKENVLRKTDMPVLLQKYESLKKMWNILYSCSDCETLTDSYEDVVEHCQNHLNNIVDYDKEFVKKCRRCNLEFLDSKPYQRHNKLHCGSNLQITRSSFNFLCYNYRNLLTGNWYKMFGDLPKEHIKCIISRSMYKATKNVRMKVLRIGQGSMFYQCATCKNYIDDNLVYDHTHGECSIDDQKPKPPHIGQNSRLISFNHQFDAEFNDTLKILGKSKIVKKPDIKDRVMVDKPVTVKKTKKLYDVYQCEVCGVTLIHRQNAPRHNCAKRRAWHCKKCDQPYLMQSKHEQYHLSLPNFNKHTINVIMFNNSNPKANTNHKATTTNQLQYKPKMKTKINLKYPSKIAAKIKNKVLKPAAPNLVPVTKIYKCKCGLHFTSMLTITKHFDICPRETIVSSKCSKCKLLFPTDILVGHLLQHHRDNNRKFIVELVEPPKKEVKLYECARCSLLFPHKADAIGHQDCGANNGERCHDCNYIFHTESFEFHECTEHIKNVIVTVNDAEDDITVNTTDNTTVITTVTSNDTGDFCNELERTVFKCIVCDVLFISLASWYVHIEANHVFWKNRPTQCNLCELKYNSIKSLFSHQKLHHNNGKTDFHVQVMDGDDMEAVKRTTFLNGKFALDELYDPKAGKKYGVSEKQYSIMLKSNYGNTLYKCNNCPQYFVTRNTWFKHMYLLNCHGTRVLKCPECEYTFVEASLLRHKFIHHCKMNLKKEDFNVLDFTETKHVHKDAHGEAPVNDLAIENNVSMMADSNDDDDEFRENAAKKIKYDSDVMNCVDDENIVSSSTKDFT